MKRRRRHRPDDVGIGRAGSWQDHAYSPTASALPPCQLCPYAVQWYRKAAGRAMFSRSEGLAVAWVQDHKR
jgi:hypothetical protein